MSGLRTSDNKHYQKNVAAVVAILVLSRTSRKTTLELMHNPEDNKLNIVGMINRYNKDLREFDEPKMTIERLGSIIFPTYTRTQQKFKVSRMANGAVTDCGKIVPSHYREICKALKCDMNQLFEEPKDENPDTV